MLSIIFLILRLLGIVNTHYDWLILALFCIADAVSEIPSKVYDKMKGED